MVVTIVLNLVLSFAASAADCSGGFLDPSLETALARFPTGHTQRVFTDPIKFERHDRELDKDAEPFWSALAEARETFATPDHNFLAMTFSPWQEGGVTYHRHLDWTTLEGRAVVGFTRVFKFGDFAPGEGARERTAYVEFFAGLVTKVGLPPSPSDLLRLSVREPSGSTKDVLIREARDERLADARLWQILPAHTDEDYLRAAMKNARLEELVERAFGQPVEPEDWNVAAAVVATSISVPPTFGPSAVLKILLGRQVKGGEKYPGYGIARGKKRYSQKALSRFVGPLTKFNEAMGIVGRERRDEILAREDESIEKGFPEWLGSRGPTRLGPVFAAIWKTLAERKGTETVARVAAKAKPRDKLTKINAKRGVILEGQNEIGVRSPREGRAAVHVWDPENQRGRFEAKPGERLRITRPPHRVGAAAMVIGVERVGSPEEGVAWYTELKASTKIVGP